MTNKEGLDRDYLQGHKKRGKKLVPPLLAMPQISLVSTLNTIFPELFWICLIQQKIGPMRSARVVIPFLKGLYERDFSKDWASTSTLLKNLKAIEDAHQRNEAGADGEILLLLQMLEEIYGSEPWHDGFKFRQATQQHRTLISDTVSNFWNRQEQNYCLALATQTVALAVAGKVKGAGQIFENVNSLYDDWDSDEAQATAAMLRASSMAFAGALAGDEVSTVWNKAFWRANYRMEGCSLNKGD